MLCYGLILFSSCRSAKYVPESEYLLDKIVIESGNKEIKANEVKPFVKQKANTRILGLAKFHLWLYNRSLKNKDGRISRALRKAGEEPVTYDQNKMVQSEREIKHYLANKGFTNARVETALTLNEKRRKIKVTYKLDCGVPYRLADTQMSIADTSIAAIVKRDSAQTLVMAGGRFDLDVLDAERERITAGLKNEGYYDFNKENFGFHVDTTLGNYKVNSSLTLETDSANPLRSYKQFRIRNLYFIVNYDAQRALKEADAYFNNMDTLVFKKMYFLSEGRSKIKPEIIYRNNLLEPNTLYNKNLSDQTHALLSAIDIVRYVNISYRKVADTLLDGRIYISLNEPVTWGYDIEGTNISGNFGWAFGIGVAHRNLLRGAEQLNLNGKIGQEAIIGLNENEAYRSRELGADLGLVYPKFVFPFLNEDFRQKSRAKTKFGLSYNYQKRPEYKRDIITADMMYSWRRNKEIRHQFTPIMLNYVSISDMTDAFREQVNASEYLKYSYENHVIFGSRYGLTFQGEKKRKDNINRYLRLTLEESGGLLSGINQLANREKKTLYDPQNDQAVAEYYDFFGERYSQYFKFDAVGVLSHYINSSNSIAYRAQFGIGVPYGNSSQLPFEKRYFGGGANGVRAWMVRSLGPGTYSNEHVDFFNQSGDINFLLSAEYRFKLFWILEGALFADAGNTWTLYNNEGQPGAVFDADTFHKQIAVGLGTGARLDFKIFVFRFDFAWKALDPTYPESERWMLGKQRSPTTHIAIGYPF